MDKGTAYEQRRAKIRHIFFYLKTGLSNLLISGQHFWGFNLLENSTTSNN